MLELLITWNSIIFPMLSWRRIIKKAKKHNVTRELVSGNTNLNDFLKHLHEPNTGRHIHTEGGGKESTEEWNSNSFSQHEEEVEKCENQANEELSSQTF